MRPVRALPPLVVEVDGAPLAAPLARALGEARVAQKLGLPAQAELVFFDAASGAELPVKPGSRLRLALAGVMPPLFDGEVTAVELAYGGDRGVELSVRGYDLLHRLRKRQPLRAHVRSTAAELARELVADLGLAVEAAADGPAKERVLQHGQSDLELLVEETAAAGLYPVLRDGALHLLTLEGIGESVALELGRTLLEARLEANGDPCCRTVKAAGWDPWRAEAAVGEARSPRVGRAVAAEAPPAALGANGERSLTDGRATSAAEAEGLAQAELDRLSAAEVVLTGVAEGNPALRPGTRVTVAGVAAPFAGRYVLTGVEHRIDGEAGYVSEITTVPPLPPPRRREGVAAWAVVTRVDDPEGWGRVKVSLPVYGELETEWINVVCLAAGAGKGLLALPEVGDRVLVLFTHGDPARGVVVGGLYGSQGLPEEVVEEGAVRRFVLRTPGGHRFSLDDAAQSVKVQTTNGSFLELGPEKLTLHAATPMTLEAPGQPIVVRGASIDFERA